MEKQLLPRAELKPAYDQAVWLWLYRDFKGSPEDRAAERVAIRFGLTSWPQHLLVDPETLEVIADTTREQESFLAAFKGAHVKKGRGPAGAKALEDLDAIARSLEETPSVEAAVKHLDTDDVVVRTRALQVLEKEAPERVAERGLSLLKIPNDSLRYAVLGCLKKAGSVKAARAVEALVKDQEGSRNPNVLCMNALAALGTCGDAASLEVIRPLAAHADPYNGRSYSVLEAVAGIAARFPAAQAVAKQILVQGYPTPVDASADKQKSESAVRLAKQVHLTLKQVTGMSVPFPETYDAAARTKLMGAW